MSRRILAAIAAVLAITLLFAACGKETITDREGSTHEFLTDENKEILQDEDGNIVVPKTDESGKEIKDEDGNTVTESITFPEVLELGDYVHNKYVKVKIEKGWEQIGKVTTIILQNSEIGAQFSVQIRENKTAEDVESIWMKQFNEEKKSDSLDTHSVKKSEVEIGGHKMIKITRDYTLKEKSADGKTGQCLTVYILNIGGESIQYTGTVSPENKDKIDFDKIVSEVIYK